MQHGLHDGNLGDCLYKKRIAATGRGKLGSYRVLVAFKHELRVFFVYGFAKNKRANISSKEKALYRDLARMLLTADELVLKKMLAKGTLIEVRQYEKVIT